MTKEEINNLISKARSEAQRDVVQMCEGMKKHYKVGELDYEEGQRNSHNQALELIINSLTSSK